jgi:biotin synthase
MAEKIHQSDIERLFDMPFSDLLWEAQRVHRLYFDANQLQVSTLASIKTGACSEDCKYCSQSAHYDTFVENEKLLKPDFILQEAKAAKSRGATRFCMGAAWRRLHDRDLPQMVEAIAGVKSLGLEACMTLGELSASQAVALKAAGLDFYNHNIDTSEQYYKKIVSTHTFEDRLKTLQHVRQAGLKVCCGGIMGMGESREDRVSFLYTLANLFPQPESVPMNRLIPIAGTPLESVTPIDDIEFVRTIAVARILMPQTMIRLSAGRANMSDSMQALCFLAGANSIFYGDKLLTAQNPQIDKDYELMEKLGIKKMESEQINEIEENALSHTSNKIHCMTVCND